MQLVLPNQIGSLALVPPFLQEVQERYLLDDRLHYQLRLVVDELLSNVIFHSYPDGADDMIELNISESDGMLSLTVRDHGIPFDPTQADDPDLTLSGDERPVGGLGIFLVRHVAHAITYSRENGANLLKIEIKSRYVVKFD